MIPEETQKEGAAERFLKNLGEKIDSLFGDVKNASANLERKYEKIKSALSNEKQDEKKPSNEEQGEKK